MLKKSSHYIQQQWQTVLWEGYISICLVVIVKYLLVYMSCICNIEVLHFKELESIMPNRDSLQSADFLFNLTENVK